MHPKGTQNRSPFSAAERAILQRPGLTERQLAKVIQAELGIRRGAASCGVERRRMNAKLGQAPERDLVERLREMSRRGYWPLIGDEAADEIERLRAALKQANDQAERFERGWYVRGDALEKLEQWARAYPLKVFPEPLREEWQRAAALLSEKGLSLDRMSASNMRHVINGVRETVAAGLKA